jgi:hypothetical protein
MPSEIVRPSAAINSIWSGTNAANIDDVVTQPAAGDGATCGISETALGAAQQWSLGSPAASGTMSAAVLWVRMQTDSNSDGYLSAGRIRLNGTWYTGTFAGSQPAGSFGWISMSISGSYGEIAGSAPAFELTYSGASPDSLVDVDVAYLDITYGAAASPSINPAVMLALLGI